MDVVLAVAIEAEVARPCERPRILVATLARQIVVHASQRKVPDIVQRLNVLERARGMALLALRSILAFVNFWLRVTSVAVGRPRLERDRGMAVRAPHFEVFPIEVKCRHRVVVEDVIPCLLVTPLAREAESAFVGVIVFVTTFSRARGGRLCKFAILCVAILALVLEVLSAQREAFDLAFCVTGERLIVIELGRIPNTADMARYARCAQRALV